MLLAAQWRGGSTLAEQLLFNTSDERTFVLDEPAWAAWAVVRHGAGPIPERLRPHIASVNADALRCNFSRYDHGALASWQRHRTELAGGTSAGDGSFGSLHRACLGRPPHARAVKTIRMSGSLRPFMGECGGLGAGGCHVVLLLRHPLAVLQSRSRLPVDKSASTTADSLEQVCTWALRDVRALSEASAGLPRLLQGHESRHAIVRYPDLLSEPEKVVRRLHAVLGLRTDAASLREQALRNFGGSRDGSPPSPYSTSRSPRSCERLTSIDGVEPCRSLLQLVHPLFDC